MRLRHAYILFLGSLGLLGSCARNSEPAPDPGVLQLLEARVGTFTLEPSGDNPGAPKNKPIVADFSAALDTASVKAGVTLTTNGAAVPVAFSYLNEFTSFSLQPSQDLVHNKEYLLTVSSSVKGKNGQIFSGVAITFVTQVDQLIITSMKIGSQSVFASNVIQNVPRAGLVVEINFSAPLDRSTVNSSTVQVLGPPAVPSVLAYEANDQKLIITLQQTLAGFTRYRVFLSDQIKGTGGEIYPTILNREFFTEIDPTPKFPVIPDEDLLTLVEQQTFKYFWDFAHPNSGLARERNTSGDIVTTGGSGFGAMAIIVGIERNFITRSEGIQRLDKIVSFLQTADRFHGAWPHWMNGNTGDVIPFGPDDNGGDLVETSFMLQGLLTVRQYLNAGDPTENALIAKINNLWQTVEFNWYTRGGEDVLYWLWSPSVEWKMNFKVRGWNEALIVYFLAAGSPTFTINASVYHQGWARNGGMANGKTFHGIVLPLGTDYGGPLFFAHYSFLGLDPNNLTDTYANYWTQNVNHSLINHSHSVTNPNNKVGYSDESWGLTASDNESGYSAHSPTNDLGVIAPTAALSSFPYTPVESMKALKFFYYTIGDRTWGPYGFYDAFNPGKGWYANSYIAIDQGPIIVMIENHRTGLLWNLFMSAPEVQTAMTKLGFSN